MSEDEKRKSFAIFHLCWCIGIFALSRWFLSWVLDPSVSAQPKILAIVATYCVGSIVAFFGAAAYTSEFMPKTWDLRSNVYPDWQLLTVLLALPVFAMRAVLRCFPKQVAALDRADRESFI